MFSVNEDLLVCVCICLMCIVINDIGIIDIYTIFIRYSHLFFGYFDFRSHTRTRFTLNYQYYKPWNKTLNEIKYILNYLPTYYS